MIIEHGAATRTVEEYDIVLSGGFPLSFTLDESKGDRVEFQGTPLIAVKIVIAEKESPINPDAKILPEEITIYASHILCITKRTRQIAVATPSQKDDIRSFLKTHPTVQ